MPMRLKQIEAFPRIRPDRVRKRGRSRLPCKGGEALTAKTRAALAGSRLSAGVETVSFALSDAADAPLSPCAERPRATWRA